MSTTERSDEMVGQPYQDSRLQPLAISTILVPLSKSASSEAALGPAEELARRFGWNLRILTVGIEQAEADAMAARVAGLASTVAGQGR